MSDRLRVGAVKAGNLDNAWSDNVAIALANYFDGHLKKPIEEDGEHGWTPWVIEQTDATLDAIAEAATEELREKVKALAAELKRLRQICVNAHDGLLRGNSDKEISDLLETAWTCTTPK